MEMRSSAETKGRILWAAQIAFSTKGYCNTGIRDLSRTLGLSTTIILKYFGSKAELFEAAFLDLIGQYEMPEVGPSFGRIMVENVLLPVRDVSPLTMLAFAAAEPESQAIAARLLKERMVDWFVDRLEPPDCDVRAGQLMSLMFGFVVYYRMLNIGGKKAEIDVKTVDWLAQSLQTVIDGN